MNWLGRIQGTRYLVRYTGKFVMSGIRYIGILLYPVQASRSTLLAPNGNTLSHGIMRLDGQFLFWSHLTVAGTPFLVISLFYPCHGYPFTLENMN